MGRPKIEGLKKKITLGYAKDGHAVRKWIHADTKGELLLLEEKEKRAFARLSRQDVPGRFGEYAKEWIDGRQVAVATRDNYYESLSRCRSFHHRLIESLTRTELQKFISGLSPSCAVKTAGLLNGVFTSAYSDGLIERNPLAVRLELPKKKDAGVASDLPLDGVSSERRALTNSERETVKKAHLCERERVFVDILYYCGLRRGEALALEKSDFDFNAPVPVVKITKALHVGDPSILKPPKNKRGRRAVPVPSQIIEELKLYLESLPGSLLFPSESGGYVSKTVYRAFWDRIRKEIGYPWLTAHWLRHDYCSRLALAPLPLSMQKRAAMCGHSYKTFVTTYLHVIEDLEDLSNFSELMIF